MAGRSTYTDADKARVYVALTANEGNVKRTGRDTGVPENTVRRWRDEWAQNGPPSLEQVEVAANDFMVDAERVRHKALLAIEEKIPEAKVGELNAVMGTLTDKIDRARGLVDRKPEGASLPAGEVIRELMAGFASATLLAAQMRQEEIIEAQIIEQAPAGELNPAK